jgi:hypothetical protein
MIETVNITVDETTETVNVNVDSVNDVVTINASTTTEAITVNVVEGGVGGDITIQNSDNTYSVVASSSPFILPDTDYDIYVNTVFYASTSLPTLAP